MKISRFSFYVIALLAFCTFANSQERVRTIDEDRYKYSNQPISITYEIGDKPFSNKNYTNAGDDWLQELVVNMKNDTVKIMIGISIELVIEKQGTMPNTNSIPLTFPSSGVPVLDSLGSPTGEYKLPVLKPGETVQLSIREDRALFTPDYLKQNGVEYLDRLILDIRRVQFEDGTYWALGRNFKRDPNDKERWITFDANLQSRE